MITSITFNVKNYNILIVITLNIETGTLTISRALLVVTDSASNKIIRSV